MSIFARAAPAPLPSHPLLDRLWARYVVDVPWAARFARLHEGPVHNDHIALRTLAAPGPGIAGFATVFERQGWSLGGSYDFADVHLRAVYLKRDGFPRVFISELLSEHLPQDARRALADAAVVEPAPDDIDALAAWFCAPRAVSGARVDLLAKSSQYGAWLLAFGRKVNHFTAAVDDVELWQLKLLQAGVPMKRDIEGAPGGDLRQTATHAALCPVILDDGSVRTMPYAYFEIAERHRGFDGFLAPQARQLFEMTRPSGEPVAVVDELQPPYHAERKHPRKDAEVPVEVAWGGGRATAHGVTRNLSLGGAFLSFADGRTPPPPGAVLELAFALPGRGRLVAAATVVRRLDDGAGVELSWWDEDEDPARAALAAFLETL